MCRKFLKPCLMAVIGSAAMVFSAFVASDAQAALIGDSGNLGVVVNSSSATRNATIAGSGTITDLNVVVDFSKCSATANSSGCVGELGSTFNNEIVLRLTHGAVTVNLVNAGTYSGQDTSAREQVTFDDEAGSAVGGPTLVTGSFQPVGNLFDFDGLEANGTWTLFFQDTTVGDPLVLHDFQVIASVAEIGVPEPGALSLFGIGLLGLSLAARRRKIR